MQGSEMEGRYSVDFSGAEIVFTGQMKEITRMICIPLW